MQRLYRLCLFFLLSCLGCSEEEVETSWQTDLLTDTTWKRTAWTSEPEYRHTLSDGSVRYYSDLFQLYVPCWRDNEYVFKNDPSDKNKGTYVYQEGDKVCGTPGVIESKNWYVEDGPFEIDPDPTIRIYLYEGEYSTVNVYVYGKKCTIEELTPHSFIFSYETKTSSGAKYTWRETLVRKE
jgi:hypothetical protein